MPEQRLDPPHIKPTVILQDTSPLVHLAAADALHILTDLGPVVIVDVVALEATHDQAKSFAPETATWIKEGSKPGQREGIIPDAEELWAQIIKAAPTANPAFVLTYINPPWP